MPNNLPSEAVAFGQNDAAKYLAELRPYVEELSDELLDVSHRIHERPEIRFEEEFASGLLSGKLEEHGFDVERGVAGLPTAFSGVASNAGGEADAPTVAIFCEYDARLLHYLLRRRGHRQARHAADGRHL